MKVWFGLLVCIFFVYGEDFISEYEYGQMLYKNPRGVSCAKCHGDLGEGSFIASFINNDGIEEKFYGPDIRKLDLPTFKKAISKGGKIMPKFYLTNKEIEAIFKYIKIVNNYEKPQDVQDNNDNNDSDIPEVVVDDNYTLDDEDNKQNNNTILGKIFKLDDNETNNSEE